MGAGILTKYTFVTGAEQGSAPTPTSPTSVNDLISIDYLWGISTNSALTGSAQDLSAPTTGVIRLTNASLSSIRSIGAPTLRSQLILINATGTAISLQDEVAGATAANRIRTGSGADYILPNNSLVFCYYDATSSRWRLEVGDNVTVASVGSSPNAAGASVSGQVLTLQPADDTRPGVLSIAAQAIGGNKEFKNGIELTHATDSATTGANAILTLPTTSAVRVTNASLTSIGGIGTTTKNLTFILMNVTGADITVVNNYASAGTGEKIYTGTGADLTLKDKASAWLHKDPTTNYWRVVGGSGGGGSGDPTVSTFTGTSVSPTSTGPETKYYGGASAQTFTGFGTISGFAEGKQVRFIGSSDTNTLTMDESDASDGWLMQGTMTLRKASVITFEYNSTLARMVEVSRRQ